MELQRAERHERHEQHDPAGGWATVFAGTPDQVADHYEGLTPTARMGHAFRVVDDRGRARDMSSFRYDLAR